MADVVRMTVETNTRPVRKSKKDLDDFSGAARKASRSLRTYGRSTDRATKSTQRMGSSVDRLRSGFALLSTGIAGVGFAQFASAIERATSQMNNINATMRVATGNAAQAAEQLGFIREEAQQLGLFFPAVSKQMAQFSAAAKSSTITGEELKTIFSGMAQASRALGLSAAQTEGAMIALQQMMSKGKISAEELRQQLGERLPGSIQIMARALDVSTSRLFEMMENGNLLADEVLPKFGKELQSTFSQQAAVQSQRIAASIQRMRNSIFDLMAQGDLREAAEVIDTLAVELGSDTIQNALEDLVTMLSKFGLVLARNIDSIALFAKVIGLIGFAKLVKRIVLAGESLVVWRQKALLAKGATVALSGSLGTLRKLFSFLGRSPAGLIFTTIAAITSLSQWFRNSSKTADDFGDSIDNVNGSLETLEERMALRRARENLKSVKDEFQEFEDARQEVERITTKLGEAMSGERMFVNFQSQRTRLRGFLDTLAAQRGAVEEYNEAVARVARAERRLFAAEYGISTSGQKMYDNRRDSALAAARAENKAKIAAMDVVAEYDEGLAKALDYANSVKSLTDALVTLGLPLEEAAALAREMAKGMEDANREVSDFVSNIPKIDLFRPAGRNTVSIINGIAEGTRDADDALQDYTVTINDFVSGMRQVDLMPPGARDALATRNAQLEIARDNLDILDNTSLSQEELLEKVVKTGTEGERLYGKWESALRDVGSVIKDDISDGLTDVIMQAESAKDVFEGLLDTIARTLIQRQVVDPFVNSVSGGIEDIFSQGPPAPPGIGPQGQGGDIFSTIAGFIPGFANGGNVRGGQAHIVGERGPEMFVPRQDGQIVPNSQMGGGGGDVTVNIINQSGERLESQEQNRRRGPNGEQTIDVMVKSSMERLDSQGQLDGIFRRHGAKRQGQF